MGIKEARKAVGLTQTELAERIGVSQSAVAQWETGITHPSYATLRPLANALGVRVDDLVEEEDDETTED